MAFGVGPGGRARPFGRAEPLRVPTTTGSSGAEAKPRPTDRPILLLSVQRGTLSIELDAPFAVGPLVATELAIALPSVRFPVDLTGGVTRFRHRRGVLGRLAVSARTEDLAAFAAPRARGVLGEGTPEIGIVATEVGLRVGMRLGRAALAFDVVIAPNERDVRLVPERARGMGLGAPPHVLALRALAEVCRPFGRLAGSAVILPDAVASLVRHVMPAAGARAPSVHGARWEAPDVEEMSLSLRADATASPPALPAAAIRAIEQAELTADADAIAASGDLEEARRRYLLALERAPRHPEISARIAWIDVAEGERAEAALSTLVDAIPAIDAGLLGGALLAAIGDEGGAIAAYARAAHAEAFGPLAALVWLEVARISSELATRLDALDQAVVRSPSLEDARWARLEARLDVGDAQGAQADAEHLEAGARGPEARHRIWSRAADAFLSRGYVAEARVLFERALRYAPDSPEAALGLALSLRAAGEGRRALDLLARAASLAARAGRTLPSVEIELARALVEHASDRPAAIARVRAIPPGLAQTAEARALEGRWRAELGDLAGASLALARLRDAAEAVSPDDPDRAAAVAAMLVEAADIEENARGDLRAAQRHLGVAIRLRPRDRQIGAAFRRISTELGRAAPAPPPQAAPPPVPAEEIAPSDRAPSFTPPAPSVESARSIDEAPTNEEDDENDEILVERLTDKLRANPRDHEVALRLADALARLGRDLELFALLSARIEEGGEEVRRELWPRRRAVLERLAETARAEGRPSEAELYEMMAASEED
ncbi:hypothetical protein [Polyangium sp. 15x6]|uniref:hypothetical protein n=1 Tax=Polyangium sp. 15x6 TaxID=3042687 RepID=UPI00249A685F|nr:hypothetical protein [Polyangium sp. 15x6]MDI3289650.1 hypothetical protein [Polyangium sp. 15x6]